MSPRVVAPGLTAALVLVGLAAASLAAFLFAARAVDLGPDGQGPVVPHEEVRIRRDEGPDLAAWWVPSDDPASRSAVLCLHGHPRSKAAVWETVRFLHDDHHLLLVDLRAHGDSDGTYTTFGAEEARDVEAATSYLLDREEVDRAGAWGVSMGAAALLLARDPRLEAVVAEAPFADLPGAVRVPGPALLDRVLRRVFSTWSRLVLGLDPADVRPVDAARDLPFPVLLVHGTADRSVPVDHAERIAEAGGDRVEVWLVEGAGHDECREVNPGAYEAKVGGFLEDQLR